MHSGEAGGGAVLGSLGGGGGLTTGLYQAAGGPGPRVPRGETVLITSSTQIIRACIMLLD